MNPIDDLRRRRLFVTSASLCTLSVLLVPVAGRSSIELPSERRASDMRLPLPQIENATPQPAIVIRRDPFAGNRTEPRGSNAAEAVRAGSNGVVGLQVVQGHSTGIELPGERDVVRAVVSGSAGVRALVEDGDRARVVSIGDPLAGSTITSIDAHGIGLRNGAHLPLEGESR